MSKLSPQTICACVSIQRGQAKVQGISITRGKGNEAQMNEVPRIRATGDCAPVLSAKVTGQIMMRTSRAGIWFAACRRRVVSKGAWTTTTTATLTYCQLQCDHL